MEFLVNLVTYAAERVWHTLSVNWWLLGLSAVIAAALKVYVDQQKVAGFLKRNKGAGIFGSVFISVTTPLCSCGTTAVILGMMASMMSWAPIVAFMVASPLTSPQELFYSASLFGWPLAIAFFVASIVLGLVGGLVAYVAEGRGWLKNQARFRPITGGSGEATADDLALPMVTEASRPTVIDFLKELWAVSRRLLLFFLAFAFIGYLLNGLIPQAWVATLFGSGTTYGVALAATFGLPLYINTEASLPLVAGLIETGMSPGAALAFLITGAGTSIGAVTGALTIARWRVVGLVIGTLWVGAVGFGYLYNLLLAMGLFA